MMKKLRGKRMIFAAPILTIMMMLSLAGCEEYDHHHRGWRVYDRDYYHHRHHGDQDRDRNLDHHHDGDRGHDWNHDHH